MKTERELLEEIRAGQLVILSKLLDAEAREKGVHRMGGDYTSDAARLIANQVQRESGKPQ